MDFKQLNATLLASIRTIIFDLVPGGKSDGNEYKSGSIYGGSGDSFSINLNTGKWSDFAESNHRGGDLISLYAMIHNLKQFEAAKQLAEKIGFQYAILEKPKFISAKYGAPKYIHEYRDRAGKITAYAIRYDLPGGKKHFSQCHYDESGTLVYKAPPAPRTLYKLDQILKHPDLPVLICEGEKSADAAQKIVGNNYITTTSMGGSQAFKKTNWNELANRSVLIWPDNDEAGIKYGVEVAKLLFHIVKTLKVLQIEKDKKLPESWDAADVPDWNYDQLKKWAASIVLPLKPLAGAETKALQSTSDPSKTNPDVSAPVRPEVLDPEIKNEIQVSQKSELNAYDAIEKYNLWVTLNLQCNNKREPFSNDLNVYLILRNSPIYQDKFRHDEFKQLSYYGSRIYDQNKHTASLLIEIQQAFLMPKINITHVKNAVTRIIQENTFNSFQDFIDSKTWDGVNRIDDFFIKYFGSHDTQYTKDVSRNFWLGLVRRGLQPGIKFDNMVILEGKQGLKKSSALKLIANQFYDSTGEDPSNKDFYLKLKGRVLVEVEELDSFRKSEATTLKKLLSTSSDNYRKPYAAESTDNPRTCIFVGTTNRNDYLSDSTGNRRYWPIECREIDMVQLSQDLDNLWAEAAIRAKSDETHWLVSEEHLESIYDNRTNFDRDESGINDAWFSDVEFVAKLGSTFNITEFLTGRLNIELSKVTQKETRRVAAILKTLGFKQKSARENSTVKKVWTRVTNSGVTKTETKIVKNHATNEFVEIKSL